MTQAQGSSDHRRERCSGRDELRQSRAGASHGGKAGGDAGDASLRLFGQVRGFDALRPVRQLLRGRVWWRSTALSPGAINAKPEFSATAIAAAYEAPFAKASAVVGIETVTSPAIARLARKFLSLSMSGGVAS